MASRSKLSLTLVVGAFTAMFFASGRWSIARVTTVDTSALWLEPRSWMVAGLAFLALAPVGRSARFRASSAMVPFLAFCFYFLTALVWAPDLELALNKSKELLLLAVGVCSVHRLAVMYGPGRVIAHTWVVLVVLFGLFGVLALVQGGGGAGERVAVLGGGPNVFGRNMALLAIACVATSFRATQRLPWYAGGTIAAILTLLSGSRGAFLALFSGMIVLFYVRRVKLTRAMYVAIGIAVVAYILLNYTAMGQSAWSAFEHRILFLTIEQQHGAGREDIYHDAYLLGLKSPLFGQGLAAFPALTGTIHPHNLFLEAFSEGGILGLGFVILTLAPTLLLILRRAPTVSALDTAAFIALLASAQFSGDFFDSRGVFLFALLIPLSHVANSRPRLLKYPRGSSALDSKSVFVGR